MKNNRLERIGEIHTSKNGDVFVIIDYKNKANVTIKFLDEYGAIINVEYGNICKGSIKNPYSATVCGVGKIGLLPNSTKPKTRNDGKHTKEYKVWHSMLCRCYTEQYQKNGHTYKDATVCDRWLVFANFLEDLPLIEGYELWINNDGYALDKDIKGNDSKIYCLENCCFISQNDNSIESYNRNRNKIHKELNKSVEEQKIKVYGINVKTGKHTKIFNSMTEASKEIGIDKTSISRCIKGKQKTCGGYKWFKVES